VRDDCGIVEFASDQKMQAREGLATEFFRVAFGPDGDESGHYRLAFVSNEANLLGPAECPAC